MNEEKRTTDRPTGTNRSAPQIDGPVVIAKAQPVVLKIRDPIEQSEVITNISCRRGLGERFFSGKTASLPCSIIWLHFYLDRVGVLVPRHRARIGFTQVFTHPEVEIQPLFPRLRSDEAGARHDCNIVVLPRSEPDGGVQRAPWSASKARAFPLDRHRGLPWQSK